MADYFEINAQMDGEHWLLDDPMASSRQDPVELDSLTWARPYTGPEPLKTRVVGPGPRADFSMAGAGVPLLTDRAVAVVRRFVVAERVQWIGAKILSIKEGVTALNVLDSVDGIDWERSEYELFDESCGNENVVGDVSMLLTLVLRASAVRGHHLFRLDRSPSTVVMSRALRDALEAECELALEFTELRVS